MLSFGKAMDHKVTEGQSAILAIQRTQQSKELLLLLHPFNGLFSRTTWVSQYQKGETILDLNEARYNGFWDAVASAGPYANNLLLAPDR